jgi:hypothetical protein
MKNTNAKQKQPKSSRIQSTISISSIERLTLAGAGGESKGCRTKMSPPGSSPAKNEFSTGCALRIDGTLERLVQRKGTKGNGNSTRKYFLRRCSGHRRDLGVARRIDGFSYIWDDGGTKLLGQLEQRFCFLHGASISMMRSKRSPFGRRIMTPFLRVACSLEPGPHQEAT